jgi:hypothetical protein
MGEKELSELLKRMHEIAKAVNAFSSETVQRDAFAALLASLDESDHPPQSQSESDQTTSTTIRVAPSKAKRASSTPTASAKVDRNLNLRPTGKKSFADFIAEKQPKSNQDRFAFAVYYLEQILERSGINPALVGTVFRLTQGWREPANIDVALRVTAIRKLTIDTSDMNDIKTTPQGRNFVEHDLPAKAGKKK